jgi:hypothetical protein
MRKSLRYLLILPIFFVISCGLLGTYDQVSLVIGIQVPIYGEQINLGLKLDLKDQAINKLQEKEKTMSIEAYNSYLDWKMKQGVQK